MAKKDLNEDEVSLDQAADRLEAIAEELRSGEGLDVDVDNRTIHLSPPSVIAMEVGVREKSSVLRGNRETVTIEMDWQPQ